MSKAYLAKYNNKEQIIMTHNFDNTRDLNTMEGIGFKVPGVQKVTNQMWGWLENRLECIAALFHLLGIFYSRLSKEEGKKFPVVGELDYMILKMAIQNHDLNALKQIAIRLWLLDDTDKWTAMDSFWTFVCLVASFQLQPAQVEYVTATTSKGDAVYILIEQEDMCGISVSTAYQYLSKLASACGTEDVGKISYSK